MNNLCPECGGNKHVIIGDNMCECCYCGKKFKNEDIPQQPQQPQPVTPQQPQPVYTQQPQPVYVQQPQPVYTQQPQQPQPVYTQQPQPVYVQQPQEPQPVYVQQPQQPQPVYTQQPQPVYVQQPQQVNTQEPQQVNTQEPQPINTQEPQQVDTQESQPVIIVPPTNSNDYLYDEEESFFEKYKVIIITFLVLAIGVVGFFVYLHNKHKPSHNNEPETVVSDTAAVDSADVAVPVQDDSEEKSHSVIRSFFDKYWENNNYQSLCQTHMTKHYAQNFLKNAKYNWRGEGVYCERCEDYEQVDPLHYEHPHQIPGSPDKVWIKSIDKYDTDKYVVTTEAQFMDLSPREYEIYRVTVTESDGKYLISCIERKDEAEHFYYDLAKMKPLKPITRNEDYEDTEEEY